MKPEELKIIAEGMGYEVKVIIAWHWVITKDGEYNLLTNDAQCMEIMEKLKEYEIAIDYDGLSKKWNVYLFHGAICSEGKTINEAVCRAALEFFKAKTLNN